MPYEAFVATVRERGSYESGEAKEVAEAVIAALGRRLTPEAAEHLGDQLPPPLAEVLAQAPARSETWGVEEFCAHIAALLGTDTETAEEYARTVLTAVADQVTGGELNKVISRLPSGYAAFFGHPELAD
ncbi:DUF2267 domain-containing protein [Streptomyces armeniacus]|uniref:DUF2267 domain-containing protein n=1 Tax=Streptomyces armeniacus TaxID=83291 RepID=A0A345XJ44_9ACTN|nr:DUF2267 domain-containing protein [Streptomyces armeniacus]AXK31660.1 DUF2267 domain-containing protein [Streptomyces armeniacus]